MSDSHTAPGNSADHWRDHGVKVIPGDQLDPDTAQTPGMSRAAAINKLAPERRKSGLGP